MAKMIQLRPIRLRRGLTQTELAFRTGLARPYLSQLERGLKSGSIDTLKLLAEILGVTTDDLIAASTITDVSSDGVAHHAT